MDLYRLDRLLTGTSLHDQLVLLGVMLGCTLWAMRRPRTPALVATLGCALLWSRANTRMEGRILVVISPGHGLTLADMLLPALAALLVLRWAADRRMLGGAQN